MRKEDVTEVYEYGGTFNPMSVVHEQIVRWMHEHLRSDSTVINMRLSADRPDKLDNKPLDVRVDLAKKCLADIAHEINIEGEYEGFIPTIYRLRTLRKEFPHAKIHFVCGIDSFHKRIIGDVDAESGYISPLRSYWDLPDDLLAEFPFVIFGRKGLRGKNGKDPEFEMPVLYTVPDLVTRECSSTSIRSCIEAGQYNLEAFVPESILPDVIRIYSQQNGDRNEANNKDG